MQKIGGSIAENTTPVMSVSTLYKIIGTTTNMHHATKNNIATKEMTVMTNVGMIVGGIMVTINEAICTAAIKINYL
jgi:hypothetical protein